MKKAFLSVSYQHRPQLNTEFAAIVTTLRIFDVEPIDFVTSYRFELGQEHNMMNLACSSIRSADLLIAEVTHKAIGVGIEVGFATALGIPIVYLRQSDAEYSMTVGGVASYCLVYHQAKDLAEQLIHVLGELGL